MRILKFKINIQKSKIPKFIKFPKKIYPTFPLNKKPNPLLIEKIDLKKAIFLFKVTKFDKDAFFFQRTDNYPIIWTQSKTNFLYPLKKGRKYPNMLTYKIGDFSYPQKSDHKFYGIVDRDLFLSTDKPFCRYIKTYNKDDNSFTNHIEYCGINKNGEKKLYGKSFIHFESFETYYKVEREKINL